MQTYRMPGHCPVCAGQTVITKVNCPECHTALEGSFEVNKFARLSPEHLDFVETFLRARGNIKEVERELGISYPTVRGRLDAVLEALGYRIDPSAAEETAKGKQAKRTEILDSLNRGEISAEEAVAQLKGL